jgi:GNAT superfamily N-acetyltransferase
MEHYASQERLKDGTQVIVRGVRSDDGPKIRRAFKELDRETVYSRFFGYKADIDHEELQRFTGVDFERDVALLVTIGSGEQEIVVGGASYFGTEAKHRPHSAEMAFTVEEDYQGLGVGTCLMRHLIEIARTKGVTHLEADVLAHNLPMLKVFRRSGLPVTVRQEGDVKHVVLQVG